MQFARKQKLYTKQVNVYSDIKNAVLKEKHCLERSPPHALVLAE